MYNEHVEAEKIRLLKMMEGELRVIITEILNENKMGKSSLKRKCFEYSDVYITMLLTKLQEIFVDSKISTMFVTNDGEQKYVLVSIDWSS